MSEELTPMERAALSDCVERGSTRCNDGGMVDTLLSILCSKPSLENSYVKWRMNPNSRQDGYISLYEPTELGRQALTEAKS
jgi:hypothetical protein